MDFWRSGVPAATGLPTAARRNTIPIMQPGELETCLPYLADLGISKYPIDLLVSKPALRSQSLIARSHVMQESLFDKTLVRLKSGVYIVSPEMSFVEQASSLTLGKLLMLGYEFCGIYVEDNSSIDGTSESTAISTPERIKSFVDNANGIDGVKLARVASRYILPNSRSPMESIITILFCLPNHLGGYSFPLPILNQRIDIGERLRGIASNDYFRCDLLWPKFKLAIEYDSNSRHTGRRNISKDAKRRNALETLGFRVITVTWEQVWDLVAMDKLAQIIAKEIGYRIRPRSKSFRDAQHELRHELLSERIAMMGTSQN